MDSLAIRINMTINGKSTRDLAKQAGVSHTQAWRWTAGRPGVAPKTAVRLERALRSNGTGTARPDGDKAA